MRGLGRRRSRPENPLTELYGARALVVASTGGHLAQAVRWSERLRLDDTSLFVTFESPQSQSLLRDRNHQFVPYVAPRDWRGVLQVTASLPSVCREHNPDFIFSTGAGIALSCPVAAWVTRRPFYYVESVSRFDGPSLTGRVLRHTPSVRCGTQHRSWASGHWPYVGSLLTDFQVVKQACGDHNRPLRIFVTLGTIAPYRFDRLIERLKTLMRPDDHVVWQLGATSREDLQGTTFPAMSHEAYQQAALAADVVVTHSGVGTILDLLESGVSPVVVPRRSAFGEHVDDHQEQVGAAMHRMGLVSFKEVEELRRSDLATRPRIVRTA